MADHVADRGADAVAAGQVGDVVPVAAHVQSPGRGPVAHRRAVPAQRSVVREHGLLQGEGDLALAGVGLSQALVELLQLPGPGVQLGFQDPVPTLRGQAAGADQLGYLLHPGHHQHDMAAAEDRGVDGAPVPLLPLARTVHGLDVVALQRHAVALTSGDHPAQRRLQVPRATGGDLRVLGEDIEQVAADQFLRRAAGHTTEVLVRVREHQLRGQQCHHARQRVEHRPVVDAGIRHKQPPSP
ncbi:hypothetical protein ABIA33_006870 [Streptacidiphilus sp. MAP12-16]